MTRCSDYEIEISALTDGESDPAMALKLLTHVAECSACSEFVRELRMTQELVDSIPEVPEDESQSAEIVSIPRRRPSVLGLKPQWVLGLAALLVVTVGVWFNTGIATSANLTNDLRDGELVIRLEEDKGRMSEERFVAMVSELLRADRRFQNEMYVVLDEITQNRESGEHRSVDASNGTGEEEDSEWLEPSSPSTAAMK
jgi:anti-sigma factor RsiW